MIWRGWSHPATSEYAKQLRIRRREVWRSAAGGATQQSASRWAVVRAHSLAHAATRRNQEESLTRTEEWWILSPADLGEADWEFMSEALKDASQRELRATSKNVYQLDARRSEAPPVESNPQRAFQLAGMLVGNSLGGSNAGRAPKKAAAEMGVRPSGPVKGGPRSKMAKVSATAGSVERIRGFETSTAKVSVPKRVAPGIGRRSAFCGMSGGAALSARGRGRGCVVGVPFGWVNIPAIPPPFRKSLHPPRI